MSLATHCIPYNEDCSICNPVKGFRGEDKEAEGIVVGIFTKESPPEARSSSTPQSKPRFLPGHLNVPTNTARNLNGDDTIWSCCGNRVEEGHSADCKRHPPASSPPPPSTPLTEEELKSAILDTPFTFDPKRGLPRPSEGFVRDAVPPSETPAELTEALDELLAAAYAFSDAHAPFEDLEGATERLRAARSALVALYNRQREEIEALTAQNAASLEEQSWLVKELSRLRVDRGAEDQIMALDQQIGMLQAENTSLSSHLERLKAEQLTEVEARAIVYGWNSPVFTKDHRQIYDSAFAKLRLRSLSDQKND